MFCASAWNISYYEVFRKPLLSLHKLGHHVFGFVDELDPDVDKNIIQIFFYTVVALTCLCNDEVKEDDESEITYYQPNKPEKPLSFFAHVHDGFHRIVSHWHSPNWYSVSYKVANFLVFSSWIFAFIFLFQCDLIIAEVIISVPEIVLVTYSAEHKIKMIDEDHIEQHEFHQITDYCLH